MGDLVAVVGRRVNPPKEDLNLALAAGRIIADSGYVLVTGGRGGIMEAAAIGATEQGGEVVAITPMDEDAVGPATLVIATGMPPTSRNVITASACDAMVALPGSHGTWQEMAVALERGVPVLALGDHTVRFPDVSEVKLSDLQPTLDWLLSND
jgi:uncharacterized protein (TIGR00725 family)